jgi:predicted enzyme related to lactoylglutathione lyase
MTTAFEEEVKPLNTTPLVCAGLTWFEIPSLDIHRAVDFYTSVLGSPLINISDAAPMFLLPTHGGNIGGALVQREGVRPGPRGTVVYLRVMDPLSVVRTRVIAAGGLLASEVIALPNVPGIFCIIRDIEGNHVGLHAQN